MGKNKFKHVVSIGSMIGAQQVKALRVAGRNLDASRHAAILRYEDGMPVVDVCRCVAGSFTTRNGVVYLADGVTICGDMLDQFEAVIYPEYLRVLVG